MHELGVVFHCLDEVKEIAKENSIEKIQSITVELGEVSTVIPYYFEDCWNWAVKREEGPLKDCQIAIEIIEAITHCENCNSNYPTVKHGKLCPKCGSSNTFLLTGNEIVIKEIAVISPD